MIKICNRIIEYSFYALFLLVPLAFTSATSELFEFNKMWLTFGLTLIIAAAWFTKMILQRRIYIQRTPLDIPILLFLLSQVISTIFSQDVHVSLWGYYSRFNGGLLSIISYIFLYYAFVSNCIVRRVAGPAFAPASAGTAGPRATDATTIVKRVLFVSLLSGLVVALWGLPSHFGYDPTCLLFRGTFDVSCWTADFQPKVRIFSTMGQPDWLAAYLAILLPIAIIMFIKVIKNLPLSIFYLLLSVLFYLDLLYTHARSGALATWVSLALFFIAYYWINRKKFYILHSTFYILLILALITFFIGQPFGKLNKFTFEGIKNSLIAPKTNNSAPNPQPTTPPHLGELGGTDSGYIRSIVWHGAVEVWKNNPIFGTGVETFAFAYYKFRPEEHNLTSEWNFLYNKAHNEFLNYLATTGIFGLSTYLGMILAFVVLYIKYYASSIKEKIHNTNYLILNTGLVASYTSILITNFFGFSVVITNIYLFMIPAFVFILGGMISPQKQFVFPRSEFPLRQASRDFAGQARISIYQRTFISVLLFTIYYLLFTLFRFWVADKNYARGYNLDRAGNYEEAYPYLRKAAEARDKEPVFLDELSINNAILAVGLLAQKDEKTKDKAVELASLFSQEAIRVSNNIVLAHPNNVVFWKTRTRVFYTLTEADDRYLPLALLSIKKASALAPTDANISYNLGVLYGRNKDLKKGIETLKNTIRLKRDYKDAHYALGLLYRQMAVDKNDKVIDENLQKKAIEQMQYILDNFSKDDKAANDMLKQWGGL